MKKQWVLLEEPKEINDIWNKIYSLFDFSPDYNNTQSPFTFPKFIKHVKTYDISGMSRVLNPHDGDGNYRSTVQIETLKSIFAECMDEDDFIYALDWQHSCFKYDPRVEEPYGYYMTYETLENTRAYFPFFYPNGDYYLFVSQDFSWGYFTHPWQKKVWVFGKRMVQLMSENSQKLGFIECN